MNVVALRLVSVMFQSVLSPKPFDDPRRIDRIHRQDPTTIAQSWIVRHRAQITDTIVALCGIIVHAQQRRKIRFVSKLLKDFANFRTWREAQSSIRIQEGPPDNKLNSLDNLDYPKRTIRGRETLRKVSRETCLTAWSRSVHV